MDIYGNYDYFMDNESDDDDECISSGDEGVYQDVKTGKLTLRTKKEISIRHELDDSSSDEDFEQMMERELDDRVLKLEKTVQRNQTDEQSSSESRNSSVRFNVEQTTPMTSCEQRESTEHAQYDRIYFDSDDEDLEDSENRSSSKKVEEKRKVLTNDELLYNPESDNEDQAWIDARRSVYLRTTSTDDCSDKINSSGTEEKVEALPHSDAVLNCPACLTMLCLDCQRHEIYETQYRAMFVFNCKIDPDEVLSCPIKSRKKKHRKEDADDRFNPVKCKICGTEVAVYDKREVYHFFNVIASHS